MSKFRAHVSPGSMLIVVGLGMMWETIARWRGQEFFAYNNKRLPSAHAKGHCVIIVCLLSLICEVIFFRGFYYDAVEVEMVQEVVLYGWILFLVLAQICVTEFGIPSPANSFSIYVLLILIGQGITYFNELLHVQFLSALTVSLISTIQSMLLFIFCYLTDVFLRYRCTPCWSW